MKDNTTRTFLFAYTSGMKKYFPLISILALAWLIRLAFVWQTGYLAEDAHITFQFARNLARGDGFAINPGQPIYGSTTPLLTILLAGWTRMFGTMEAGALLIDMLAVGMGILFLWMAFEDKRAVSIALTIMALSARLYVEEMQGMEMPLLFAFLAGSYYAYTRERPSLAGVMAGLMLWTRIDAAVWVGCLFGVWFFQNRKHALQYGSVTAGLYLPWIAFAWLYFDSPIPFTIIAKQVAYSVGPYGRQLWHITTYLSLPIALGAIGSTIVAWRERKRIIFPLFLTAEIAVLVISGSTFFDRYFYLVTLTAYILLGIGLARLLANKPAWVYVCAFLLIAAFSLPKMQESFRDEKRLQAVRHQTLTEIGSWLNENTPDNSTVLLEPLGYVGFYADRIMLDEVGLVTPLAVDLHRERIGGNEFYKYFQPDYVIWTCGEGGNARGEIVEAYTIATVFDGQTDRSCYEIWSRKPIRRVNDA